MLTTPCLSQYLIQLLFIRPWADTIRHLAYSERTSTVMTPSPRLKSNVSTTQLTTLPSEILANILDRCVPLSLKQLRRSSTFLRDLATPRLFETIELYPHMQHFASILELSKHPRIRVHVRTIIYELRYVDFARRIIKRIESVYSTKINQLQRDLALQRARDFDKQTLNSDRKSFSLTVPV